MISECRCKAQQNTCKVNWCASQLPAIAVQGSVAVLRGFAFGLLTARSLLLRRRKARLPRRLSSEPRQPIRLCCQPAPLRIDPAPLRLDTFPLLLDSSACLLDETAARMQPFNLLLPPKHLLHVLPADSSPSRAVGCALSKAQLSTSHHAEVAFASAPSSHGSIAACTWAEWLLTLCLSQQQARN